MADRMMGAFDTPTGIPLGQIDLKDSKSAATSWAGQGNSILSELGSVQLEFVHLSTRTGNATYRIAAERIIEFLHDKYRDQVGKSSCATQLMRIKSCCECEDPIQRLLPHKREHLLAEKRRWGPSAGAMLGPACLKCVCCGAGASTYLNKLPHRGTRRHPTHNGGSR